MSSYKSFIHFGCWNYNKCDSSNLAEPVNQEDYNVTKVMKTIKKYIEISDPVPEFLTVAGDNYYFVKKKKVGVKEKEKEFNREFLLSGFNCLPKDIKKFVLIGNHDLENIENPLKYPDCSILEIQQNFASDASNNVELDIDRKGPIMHDVLDESTIVIMLDTTMYETSEKSINKGMKCYQRMFEINELDVPENVAVEKIKVMRENQKQRLGQYISSLNAETIKNIIVVGHHPLFDLKTKKDDESGKIKTKEEVMPLLNELYYESIYAPLQAVNSEINYFYLCADLHQYQTGVVTITEESMPSLVIQQYIVGTGGTELEKKPYDHSKDGGVSFTSEKYKINYDIIPNENEYTHGFLVCNLDTNKNFSAEFIPADSDESVGGTSYKNKKKKRTMKKRTMKKRTMKKRTMKKRTMKKRTMKKRTMKKRTMKKRTMKKITMKKNMKSKGFTKKKFKNL